MNKIGSSETIRKTTFNFNEYAKNTVSHKSSINKDFLEWFIGFSEGDGSFIVSKGRLFFIINQKEEKILHDIRTNLGFGKVSVYKSYSRYIVADKTGVDRLISIFNGNLILSKTNTRFLHWLTARNLYSTLPIEYIKRGEEFCFNNNGWLSGFIDAEGCFNASKIKSNRYSLGFRVRLRFILDQKGELFIFTKVKHFLESGFITDRSDMDKTPPLQNMFRFTTSSIRGLLLLQKYLHNFPLRTFKKVSFLRFYSLYYYIKNRPSLPWQGKVLKRVENLLNRIQVDDKED